MPYTPDVEIIQGRPGIQGPKGDKGDRGPMGLEGPTGPEGPQGPRGEMGIQGFEGRRGPKGSIGLEGRQGPKGDRGPTGKDGAVGKDGKDASPEAFYHIADQKVSEHEASFDHTKIDPFLIGTKKISEAGMQDGEFIRYDAKGDRLVYATIKQVAQQVQQIGGRGLSLPSQSGRDDRILQTDGNRARWGMKITVSATEPTDPEVNDLWLDIS